LHTKGLKQFLVSLIKIDQLDASDIKLVYLYSTIKMMHGPINISFLLKIS